MPHPFVTRRDFLVQAAIATAGLHDGLAQQPQEPATVIRTVAQGKLRGEATKAGQNPDGLVIFRGVPFAQPPVGPLRFRPPQRPAPWTGIREALRFAAAAPQLGDGGFEQSEDCLYLNLWAPAQGGPYPILVWIHGGGFTGGRASEPLFDGSHFARAGIVCITVAYRLGALGFLDVSPLLGPTYAGSADNPLRDLIAALEWVQENASAFGGDKQRVTIGGESAGAKLTDMLMGVPSARPLFHQMISESGGAERIWPSARAVEVAGDFGAAWRRQTSLEPKRLLDAPIRQILEVQDSFTRDYPLHFPLRAELDSNLVPRLPIEAIHAGSTRGKRLLLGTNRDESAFFLGPHPQKELTGANLGNLTLAQFQSVEQKYRELYPTETEEWRRIHSVTAEEYWIPSIRVAEAHVAAGGEAFVYRLDFPGTGRFAGLAFHSYDLRFVWENFGQDQPSAAAQSLATAMHDAWVAFIKSGTPAAAGLPEWSAYSLATRPTMILDQPCRLELDPAAAELKLWDGLLVG